MIFLGFMTKLKKFAVHNLYFLVLVFLALYSYSQIDLNLTLSSWQPYQNFQKQMIQLGYFNRPLSSLIYLVLIILLSTAYYLFLKAVEKKKLVLKQIKVLILGTVFILLFSYPAFSHDIFNYIFDARIVVQHQENPWTHTALDFPDDLWTRFMHWTHRTFPYGPAWLLMSVPVYLLGFNRFVLTLFSFKLLFVFSYLGSCFLIYKILEKIDKKNALLGLVFFAFNPLVLIEGILSPHLDSVMAFFGLLAIKLLLDKRRVVSFLSLVFSIATKYVTFAYLFIYGKEKSLIKKLPIVWWLTLGMIILQIALREILPWYFLPLLAISSLTLNNSLIENLSVGISLGGVFYYLPFLFFGEYTQEVQDFRLYLFFTSLILSLLFSLVKRLRCLTS